MTPRFRTLFLVLPFAALLSACASSPAPAPEAKTEEAPAAETAAADTKPADTKPGAKPERAKPAAAAARPAPAARAASAPKPRNAEDEKVEEPLDQAQASGQCWMQVDKRTNLSLEQKAAFVDKCVDETLAADRKKWAAQPKQ
jgi:ABC-type uncharacterized transport system involved in gliding motility auxiliary subunit